MAIFANKNSILYYYLIPKQPKAMGNIARVYRQIFFGGSGCLR